MLRYGYLFETDDLSTVIDPSRATQNELLSHIRYIESNDSEWNCIVEINETDLKLLEENGFTFNESLTYYDPDKFELEYQRIYN